MNNFPLNKIIHLNTGWICHVLQLDTINTGGLYLSYDHFSEMEVAPFNDCCFRLYRKSKKIMLSNSGNINFEYCALDLKYDLWECLLCKKICKNVDAHCFCSTYSTCWTPIKGEITGALYNNDGDFLYHFNDDVLSNLIL